MAGHNLRVALESRWITKDKGTQIIFSRSFIVLVVQQNFFYALMGVDATSGQVYLPACVLCAICYLLAWGYFEWYAHRYTFFHQIRYVGIYALFEAIPAALWHLCPAGFGKGECAWECHICDAVDVAYSFAP